MGMQSQRNAPAWLPWAGTAVLLFLVVATLVFWFLNSRSVLVPFSSNEAGVHLKYDSLLKNMPLGDQDSKDKIVLRLQQANDDPELLVTVRYEDNLKPVATAAKQDLRDALTSNLNKTYPQRFPQFHQVSTRNFEVNGHKASELVFTYKSPSGASVKQRFILIAITDDKAAYLAIQSKENDFDRLNGRYFNAIASSLLPN